jgi:deoxyribose-phosphate aldolase
MDQMEMTASKMAQYIDHTLLKADAHQSAFDKLCDEAAQHQFKAVCVNSCRVAYVAEKLEGSGVEVCSVVGFPLGAMETLAKAFEASQAVGDGATEVDMVINVGALKSGDLKTIEDDIRALRKATEGSTALKVIIETCLLTEEEKILACEISKKVGADFVKSSTGFSTGGATLEDIALMRKVVGSDMGVKASGGIKDFDTAFAMINAGANRLGTSSGVIIVEGIPR